MLASRFLSSKIVRSGFFVSVPQQCCCFALTKQQGTQRRSIHKGPDYDFDVVVVGSGCAGLTTAVVAAKHGLKVLVVEKSKYFGGTTAFSGGGLWIPNNKHQQAAGVTDDSYKKADLYLHQVLGELYEPNLVNAYLKTAPLMVRWMEENTTVKFKPVPLPDYHTDKEGTSVARTILTEAFDGRKLGRKIRDVRYTLQGLSGFGSMQADASELSYLTNPFGNATNFVKSVKKISRYITDLITYGKGTEMANGNALIGRLIHTCLSLPDNIELWKSSPAFEVYSQNGRIAGLNVSRDDGREVRIGARKGVVLASGGFGRSEKAQELGMPPRWSVQPSGNVGDGIRLGTESGAVLPRPNPANAIYAPVSLLQVGKCIRRYPHFALDRSKPGSIIVGPDGHRFANESLPYQEFVQTMKNLKIEEAYFIGDQRFLRKYGMGMALPWPYPIRNLIRQGYLIEARTIAQLAEKIGVSPDALESTVSRANTMADKGEDEEFQRGANIYDQFYGDPANEPNPNLGRCQKSPFYALKIYPGAVSTMFGLQVDEESRVLGAGRVPIEGLYAVGCDQNSVMRGTYPGGGSSIGPGMTFGFKAGFHLAGEKM